jgi:FkbM family methyltransferase
LKRIILSLLALIFIGLSALVLYGYTHRARTVKAYYRLERKWGERPSMQSAEKALEAMEPFFLRVGLLGPARIQVEPKVSYELDPRDLVPLTILRTGEWQPEIWNALTPVLPEGGVLLDVGAHIGYYSMKAAPRVGPMGRVVAFEPNPETLRLLRDNVSANHFANVTVEPIACTDKPATLTLYAAAEANTGASSLSRDNAEISATEKARAFTVQGRPIDDVVRELGLTRVDAIKIDVEGAEVIVLRGAVGTLKRFHPKVIAEVVPRQLAGFKTTPEDLRALLRDAGYNQSRPLNPEETDWEWMSREPASVVNMSDLTATTQLVRGFYQLEGQAWRWSSGHFTVALHPPAKGKAARLVLRFLFPEASFQKLKTMTIAAKIGDVNLESKTFAKAGEQTYEVEVPAGALGADLVNVDFTLDHVLKPEQADGRELGVVVMSAGLR